MLQELLQYDKELFLFLNNMGTPSWDSFWMFMTHKLGSIPLYIMLLVLSYRQLGWKGTLVLLVTIALLITVTDQLANFFKYGVQRLRPCYDADVSQLMRLVKKSCGGKYGYFSAHAASSMAVASFFSLLLSRKWRFIPFLLIPWALVVAYSRVYIGVHFPLDIVTGIGVGCLFGWVFLKLYIFILVKISL